MSDKTTDKKRIRVLLAILMAILGAALLITIASILFSPHDLVSQPLLAELPKAELIYDGLTLQMDDSASERFYLVSGFSDPGHSEEVEDHSTRDVASTFRMHFTRWQLKDISLHFHLLPFQGTQEMSLILNNKPASSAYLAIGYQDVVFPLPNDALVQGDNVLQFQLNGGANPGAAIDFIRWEVGGDVLGGELGVDRRTDGDHIVPVLGLSGSGEFNFYLSIPNGAKLMLGLGHDQKEIKGGIGKLRIWGRSETGEGRMLWEGEFPQNGIRHLELNLGGLEGSITLLSFYITSVSNQSDWLFISEPRLMVPKAALPPLPSVPPPPQFNNKHPRTIVLICEDALRRDFLPIYGKKIIRTPNLDAIADNALVFDNAYSPSSWTKHVFASIYTAQPGVIHGATKHENMLREDTDSLVELFGKNHWRTAVITANPYTSNKFGLTRGFRDYFYLFQGLELQITPENKVNAEIFLPVLSQWLASLAPGEDAFIVIHMMDTHSPYAPPPAYRNLYKDNLGQLLDDLHLPSDYLSTKYFSNENQPNDKNNNLPLSNLPFGVQAELLEQFGNYCASITYFDEQLPKMLKLFAQAGRDKGTTFVFFADHGEEFLDHGGIKHGFTLYQEMIHVPLLMWGEEIRARRTSEYVNLEDLMPTLLDIAGITVPAGLEGRSFVSILSGQDVNRNQPQFAETEQNPPNQICLTWQGWKLIIRGNLYEPTDVDRGPLMRSLVTRGSSYELYNLINDPLERKNLDNENPIRVGFMKGMLVQWWMETNRVKHGEVKNAALDAHTIEILKGLGYVQ